MNQENWKPIVGFETLYEISDHGRVRRSAPGSKTYVGKILKTLKASSTEHQQANLYDGRHYHRRGVHALVIEAFIGPRPLGKEVNHRDGNPRNNHISNLEYVTRRENHRHASTLGLLAFGTRNGAHKLTHQQVYSILKLIDQKIPDTQISKKFHVCPETIRKIRLGKTWSRLRDPCSLSKPQIDV